MGGNWELSQEVPLNVIVQVALAFRAGKEKHYHLNPFVQLLFESLDPGVDSHARPHLDHVWLRLGVAALVQALFHGRLELVGNLSVAIAVEDSPCLQLGLREHLALDFPLQITRVRLDVN